MLARSGDSCNINTLQPHRFNKHQRNTAMLLRLLETSDVVGSLYQISGLLSRPFPFCVHSRSLDSVNGWCVYFCHAFACSFRVSNTFYSLLPPSRSSVASC